LILFKNNMSLAPWRSPLARALHRNRALAYSRYLQLATVRPDGTPANRTIVFRGFLGDTNQLKFVTDYRSEKSRHIVSQPWGEACWYFPKTREQFRLGGPLTLVTHKDPDPNAGQARLEQWQALSESARVQFVWPHPGQSRSQKGFEVSVPEAHQPPHHFCLLVINPIKVDHLELRGDPQNRTQFVQDQFGDWLTYDVNP
jgi:pyridoxamine 5'-phosphate oxidase